MNKLSEILRKEGISKSDLHRKMIEVEARLGNAPVSLANVINMSNTVAYNVFTDTVRKILRSLNEITGKKYTFNDVTDNIYG